MQKINRVYIPYSEWEDFTNGMWRSLDKYQEPEMISKAVAFTENWELYGGGMAEVIEAWPKTMLNSLTNTSVNRRAFLGHCACQYKIKVPEYLVRVAWGILTDKQRFDADAIAQQHINNWVKSYERKNRKIHKGLGEQLLLQWPT